MEQRTLAVDVANGVSRAAPSVAPPLLPEPEIGSVSACCAHCAEPDPPFALTVWTLGIWWVKRILTAIGETRKRTRNAEVPLPYPRQDSCDGFCTES